MFDLFSVFQFPLNFFSETDCKDNAFYFKPPNIFEVFFLDFLNSLKISDYKISFSIFKFLLFSSHCFISQKRVQR